MIVGPSIPTPIPSRIPGTPAFAISWLTMTCSIGPSPWPPNASGHGPPASPAPASVPCQARREATISCSSVSAPSPRRTGASPLCSSSQERTFSRYCACSGESFRSTEAPLLADWPVGCRRLYVGQMDFAELSATSDAVRDASARTEKVALLAAALARLAPEEVEAGTAFLSGELVQRQIGVGWAALNDIPP